MKTMFVLTILYFLATGCSSSIVVKSTSYDSSVIYFNEFAEGREAKIILKDNVVTDATNVYLSADSLSWNDRDNILKSSVVKSDVRKIIFTENFLGAIEGLIFGIPSGGIAGFVTAWASGGGLGAIIILPGFGVIVGALIGFTTGIFIGHKFEYDFEKGMQIGSNTTID